MNRFNLSKINLSFDKRDPKLLVFGISAVRVGCTKAVE